MLPVYLCYMLASFFIYEFFLQTKSGMYIRHIFPTVLTIVLDATIQKVLFRKVLIDGGSTLNLLFAKALKELGLRITDLTPSELC